MWKNDATCKSDNRKALKYVMALAWLTFQEAEREEEEDIEVVFGGPIQKERQEKREKEG